jgi:hypothetical protein
MQPGDKVRLTLKARRRTCREFSNIQHLIPDLYSCLFGTMVFVRFNHWDNNWAIVRGSGFTAPLTVLISDLEIVK